MKNYISYSLPKSVTTVALVKRKPSDAYDSVTLWLRAHTNYEIETVELHLIIPKPTQSFDSRVIERVDRDYCNHYKLGGIQDYTGKETSEWLAWSIPKERINDALKYLNDNSDVLSRYYGEITISIYFLLLDANGQVFPRYHDNKYIPRSHLLLFLRKNSCIAPDIYFPFSDYVDNFKRYYNYLKLDIPFKINDKHLRLCSINKNGNIIIRKLNLNN